MGKGIIIAAVFLVLPSFAVAGQIYLLRLNNGGLIKCRSIKEQGGVVLCDADGLVMTIGKSTIKEITAAQGVLTKTSPQVGPRAGSGPPRQKFIKSEETGQQTTPSIKSSCEREWKDDYRMVEYCIKQQTEAWSNLRGWSGSIKDKCAKEWGTDYRMVEYCTKKQSEAKGNLDSMR